MFDAGSPRDVRKAEREAKRFANERITFLRETMDTSAGRRWLLDLLTRCHLFNDPFTGDPIREAYHKGERNIGLSIFADIVANCPDQYVQMMRESYARSSTPDRSPAPERSSVPDPDGGDQGREGPEPDTDPDTEPDAIDTGAPGRFVDYNA